MLRNDLVIVCRETQKKTGVSHLIKSTLFPSRIYKETNSKSYITVKTSLISFKNTVKMYSIFLLDNFINVFLLVTD